MAEVIKEWGGYETPATEPVDLTALPPNDLAAACASLGLELPTVTPGDTLIISTLDPEPGLACSAALFAEQRETLLAGLTAARRLWPGHRVAWAVAAPQDAPAGAEYRIVSREFPHAVPAVLKKRLSGLGDPLATGVLGGRELYFLGRLWRTGLPLTRTVLTVAGANYLAPVGAPVGELLKFANIYPHGSDVVVAGGLVRGTSLARLDRGLGQRTAALNLVKGGHGRRRAGKCLHCRECSRVCPAGLAVHEVASTAPASWNGPALRARLAGCLACGACAWACPVGRPLMAMLRLSFPEVWGR